jgi:hypothetical protein
MPSSKKAVRNVERVSHLFLSAQSPRTQDSSRNDKRVLSPATPPPGQPKMTAGARKRPELGNKLGSRSGELSRSAGSGPALTLLDFLLDDEVEDGTY